MNSSTLIILALLCFILCCSPRRYIMFPFIVAACFVPMNQVIDIFGLNFTVLRILIICGCLRMMVRRETRILKWNSFDKLILGWAVTGSVIYIIQQANFSSIVFKSGALLDSIGMYWITRQLIITWDDVFQSIKLFAIVALLTAPLIVMEKIQESSFFSIFGPTYGMFHRGRYRAAGPFSHYILLGCFWITLIPFFYASIKANKERMLCWIAIASSLCIMYCSASSTPILTLVGIIIFWNIHPYRVHGALIFRIAILSIFLLHLIMKAPVWHLMSRVDIYSGSTGWYRYALFDNFIKNISSWFLLGLSDTTHWGQGMTDITNQFVLEAVRGGMVTLLFFIAIMYRAVKIPGKLSVDSTSIEVKWISWAICIAMLGHFITFWSVSYMGQINLLLYFSLALVGFCLEKSSQPSPARL